MSAPDGYDPETFAYVGPCPKCGTAHDGWHGPESLGGSLMCVEQQARAMGLDDVADSASMTLDYARVVQANALGLPFS